MGVVEDEVKRLHGVVQGLEQRIKKLEERQFGAPKSTEEVRMILIGPPGAGERALMLKSRAREECQG